MAEPTLLQRLAAEIDRSKPEQVALYEIIAALVAVSDIDPDDVTIHADIIKEKTAAAEVSFPDDIKVDVIHELTAAAGVTIDGVKLKDSEVTTDVINEKTAAAGVTADSVLLKDGLIKVLAGLVSNLAVKIGAIGDNGFYEVSATQIGVAIQGALKIVFDSNGLSTDVINERIATLGVTIDGVLLKDSQVNTNVINELTAAAGVTVDSVLLKDGGVTTTNWLFNNASGTIVPLVENTNDIGNLLVNPRDIHVSRSLVKKGIASTEGYGQLAIKSISNSKAFAGGATEVIPIQVPANARIISCQLRNDTTLVGAGAATYSAAYSGGSTQAISSGTAFTKNAKVDKMFNTNANTDILTALTDITLTPNAGVLDTGTVTAVVYYYELTSLTNAA